MTRLWFIPVFCLLGILFLLTLLSLPLRITVRREEKTQLILDFVLFALLLSASPKKVGKPRTTKKARKKKKRKAAALPFSPRALRVLFPVRVVSGSVHAAPDVPFVFTFTVSVRLFRVLLFLFACLYEKTKKRVRSALNE